MGVKLKLILFANDQKTADRAANKAVRRVEELEQVMSDYRPASELNLLSDQSCEGFQPVSANLHAVITRSMEISRQSGGAFDITVGPIVQLWRKARLAKRLPTAVEIRHARNIVGHHLVKLKPGSICLDARGMRLDMGGIGKGIGADAALSVLQEEGLQASLVELGGDIAVGEAPPGRDHWVIDIELGRSLFIGLSNQGIATSGDTEQFIEVEGVRYSHIVDPRTGVGLTNRCRVTVIASDGATADALASAVSVLGPAKGIALIETIEDAEAAIFQKLGSGTVATHTSSGFKNLEVAKRPR